MWLQGIKEMDKPCYTCKQNVNKCDRYYVKKIDKRQISMKQGRSCHKSLRRFIAKLKKQREKNINQAFL